MPNSLQTLDTSFPKIDNHQTTEENLLQVTNYLYMLLENLRYTLGNLGVENINDTEMKDIAKMIQEPVYARIKDQDSSILALTLKADQLNLRVEDVAGDYSEINQQYNAISATVYGKDGKSGLAAFPGSLELKATSSEDGTRSVLTLTGNGITAQSAQINLTGLVSFTDLSTKGKTSILGDNLKSGTIEGVTFKALGPAESGLDDITIENGKIKIGGADLTFAKATETAPAKLIVSGGTTPVFVGTMSDVELDGSVVRIKVGGLGKRWELTTGGIYFWDLDGEGIPYKSKYVPLADV